MEHSPKQQLSLTTFFSRRVTLPEPPPLENPIDQPLTEKPPTPPLFLSPDHSKFLTPEKLHTPTKTLQSSSTTSSSPMPENPTTPLKTYQSKRRKLFSDPDHLDHKLSPLHNRRKLIESDLSQLGLSKSPLPSPQKANPSPKKNPNLPCEKEQKTPRKRKRTHLANQTYLDLGQKDYGGKTCSTCSLYYCPGDPVDEELHRDIHRKYLSIWDLPKRKSEECIHTFESGDRIVKIESSTNSRVLREKFLKIRQAIDTKLGCPPTSTEDSNLTSYLYVSQNVIVGVVIVKMIEKAFSINKAEPAVSPGEYKAITCSTDPVPAVLGVSRIWVREDQRRKGLATILLDVARQNFIFGSTVSKKQCAFSQPTKCGNLLAGSYFDTPQFLVFHDSPGD